MTPKWATDAFFYHLYPIGALGAPRRNAFTPENNNRLRGLEDWLDSLESLGITALLLGPVFESSSHGYDIADYFLVDRRLGDAESLARFSRELHRRGMKLVLDSVFHHTGRDFPAFKDCLERGERSAYVDWYHLDFSRPSPLGDPFHYRGWAGHYDLVKLNLASSEVRQHLFAAVASWIERFQVDGLRLDAADKLDPEFRRDLAAYCGGLKPDFWLLGEVVHGDYREWVHPKGIHSVTNYEIFKGLWSSHNDKNYFEIAHSLERQFGAHGIYRELDLFLFADNHDVDRIASKLTEPAHLYPLHILLMTMPGIPSVYYGSEWGMQGVRTPTSDLALRPPATPSIMREQTSHPALQPLIKRLAALRCLHAALRHGGYRVLWVAREQFAFMRGSRRDMVMIAVNSAATARIIRVAIPDVPQGPLIDVLNEGEHVNLIGGEVTLTIPPRWGRILIAG